MRSNIPTHYVSEKELRDYLSKRRKLLYISLPEKLREITTIERVPPDKNLSAWTVELYIHRDRTYRKCTRLYPFKVLQSQSYVRLKVFRKGRGHTFDVASCKLVRLNKAWVWAIRLSHNTGTLYGETPGSW